MKADHITIKFILASIIFLAGFQMNAQEKRLRATSAEEISAKQTEFFADQLELNATEAQELGKINFKYAKQAKEFKEEGRSKETREKLEKLNHAQNEEVKALLNDEDFGEYLVLKKKMHERMRMKMKERHIEAQYKDQQKKREHMHERKAYMEKLNLNDEQKEQLKSIKETYRKKHQALRSEGRSEETHKKLEALLKEQNKEVRSVLDEDQYKIYLEMQEQRKEKMKRRRG